VSAFIESLQTEIAKLKTERDALLAGIGIATRQRDELQRRLNTALKIIENVDFTLGLALAKLHPSESVSTVD
jgi:hypothetical protein